MQIKGLNKKTATKVHVDQKKNFFSPQNNTFGCESKRLVVEYLHIRLHQVLLKVRLEVILHRWAPPSVLLLLLPRRTSSALRQIRSQVIGS